MADQSQPIICGIDVASKTLDIARSDGPVTRIGNSSEEIEDWLATLPDRTRLAMEATGRYHESLLEQALAAGHEVYLINGQRLNHYREAVGTRAKTDPEDARLLMRYLEREWSELTPVKCLNGREKGLWRLLQRRATLVRARTQLRQSLGSDPATRDMVDEVSANLNRVIARIECNLRVLARELGWEADIQRCRSIPGIGPLNALALVASFRRGDFSHSDRFVAYLGLDVRVRDSGKCPGRRKLTKRGNPELRRLLYNAAMSAARNRSFQGHYERYKARGLSKTAALVVIARKLVRIAFALLSKGERFDAEAYAGACNAT